MLRIFQTLLFFLMASVLFSQDSSIDIPALLKAHQKMIGISEKDISEYAVADTYTTDMLQVTHVYLQQQHKAIDVFNGILNLNIKDGNIVSYGNRWVSDISERSPDQLPSLDVFSAIQRAADNLGIDNVQPIIRSAEKNELGQETKFLLEDNSISRQDIPAELKWFLTKNQEVKLCWEVQIYEMQQENFWTFLIDAHTGEMLQKFNQIIECSFGENNCNHRQHPPMPKASVSAAMMTEDSSYMIFPLTIESPNHGDRQLVVTPWDAAGPGNNAVTLNWHDDGTSNYTTTRGNNVHAYEDIDNNNLPGFSPDSSNLRFNYPFDPYLDPEENMAAAITNLFFWNNVIHDIMYQHGFDEVSGNFQNDNLGRGGNENDYVRAEGLDGGGSNNANFYTPADGTRPRMQMYLWSEVSSETPLTINAPESIAGEMWAVESGFSNNNKLGDIGLTTGDIVLVEDAVGNTHLACGELSNEEEIDGKIALIDRGSCNFTVKVKKVQDLGAIAAIVVNNVGGAPIPMGGQDNSITIPAVMISLADGDLIKAVLDTSAVNASLDSVPGGIIPDGDYDNAIIAHEYGHGISIRLTGGPNAVNCLYNEEQMGEGWSDYFGLMLTTDWTTAEPEDRRGIGTYVLGEPTDGTGIRTYPYTTDMEINPFTYANVADAPGSSNSPSPHFVGSVWCTMLWDMTWEIIDMAGVDTDLYHGTGGNNIALDLVINALKLQPCSPGFVDGRDAILLADEMLYGGQYKCAIWRAFARRGLGTEADQGSSDNFEDGVESFATPEGVSVESAALAISGTEGQDMTFQVRAICGCTTQTDIEIKDKLSEYLIYIPGSGGAYNGEEVVFTIDTLEFQDTIEFTYRAFINACSATDTLLLNEDDAESPDQYTSIKLAGTGTLEWVKNSTEFVSPTQSYYAEDYDQLADYALTLSSSETTSGPVEISFLHRYETEENYDGGVVEYSLDGGVTWLDAGPYFLQNGYPESINAGGTDSPIAGRDAFTGDSDVQFNANGFIESRIRVCSDINQAFRLRFRFVADGGVGGSGLNGWYIDDITIHQLSGVVNKSTVAVQDIVQDTFVYCLPTSVFPEEVIYVDENAPGNLSGTSWPGAMHYLPMALAVASCRDADTVCIAEGIYLPNQSNDRTQGFVLSDSIEVFGGFPTGGSSFAQRNPAIFLTILSGDLGISDDSSDNVFHLISCPPGLTGIVLDGLHLRYANADGEDDFGKGAAVFNRGEISLNELTMTQNYGRTHGQIIYNEGETARMTLTNCTIYTPDDTLIKLLNEQSARFFFFGNTQILKE